MSTTGKIILATIFAVVLVIILSWKIIFKVNTRWFIKDNIKAWADLNINRENNYNIIEIGGPDYSFDMISEDILFKFEENDILKINKYNIPIILKKAYRVVDANKYEKKWPKGAKKVYSRGYLFVLNSDDIFYFRAHVNNDPGSKKSPVPAIGLAKDNKIYNLPLSKSELIDIFGKPDEIKDFFKM